MKKQIIQFSRSVVSDCLGPHESQYARPPCPSPTPRVHSDSRPSSQWCHPAIASSVIPFSSCPQPSQHQSLFQWVNSAWDGQSTGVSAAYISSPFRAWNTAAAAAAKSLQSYPTLCDSIDGSPPGFSVHGMLQARTLEWIAISFSNAWKWKVKVKSLSSVWLFETPWTAAYQAPLSVGVSRQEYLSGLPLPSPGTQQTRKKWLWNLTIIFWASSMISRAQTVSLVKLRARWLEVFFQVTRHKNIQIRKGCFFHVFFQDVGLFREYTHWLLFCVIGQKCIKSLPLNQSEF